MGGAFRRLWTLVTPEQLSHTRKNPIPHFAGSNLSMLGIRHQFCLSSNMNSLGRASSTILFSLRRFRYLSLDVAIRLLSPV